ncbi:MAG: M48 family peptidase [Bryobacterales bacterium]|nr:M48 family peptidase [Bryobacterales bacterium]
MVETALLFETPAEIYERVFRDLKPRTEVPEIAVRFCRFANANSFIRLENNRLEVKISDMLEGAPAPIQEALAYILLAKLYRKPILSAYSLRYRRWLNRADVRRQIHVVRSVRGRKFVSGPAGEHYNLEEMFEDLNVRFFGGLMARPQLGWSKRPSKTLLGHYDPSHHAIIISRILDRAEVPRLAVEYVMYHEMLHLRHPVDHRGTRRCVHTPEFRADEKQFPNLAEAKKMLRRLP